ncbi:ABC transporter permease [Halioxenophilus aromaticivorans]|uniref:ABC transporter permease n=1 Tax=Halioxenophilus aromaticivorans TaxID=1306992 RepID=A0AAV3U1V7_9ALTE
MKSPLRYLPWEYLGLFCVLLALIGLFGLLSDHFLTLLTFTTIANQIPALAVIAIGMTFVLLIAGIDLSVGSLLALSGALIGWVLVDWQQSILVAACVGVMAGAVCGLINGFISAHWAIPSFIVTLGMLEIGRGAAYLTTGSQTHYLGASVSAIATPLPGLGLSPSLVLAVLLVVIGQVVLSKTVFGRYLIAVGTNEEAVRLSGIKTTPIKIAAFVISGLMAGLGGLFHVAYLESADPNAGIGLELSAIAAVVIGGTSLAGGRGSVVNSFLGVLIIAVLQTGLAQVGASEPTKRVITGVVIVVAVILDVYRHRAGDFKAYAVRVFRLNRPASD